MRLLQLRYFVEVCETGNVTKAAANLHISQPAITVAIRELETELGIRLFHRQKQRIYLTQEGSYFLGEVTGILGQLDELKVRMLDFGKHKNHIVLGVPPMMGTFLLPQLLIKFQAMHPEIKMEIYEAGAKKIKEQILDEKIDMGFGIQDESTSDELFFIPLRESEFCAYVGKSHPLAETEGLDFQDIADQNLLSFDDGFYINGLIRQKFAQLNLKPPRIMLESGQVETIKKIVAEGTGICFLEKDCVSEWDALVALPFRTKLPIVIGAVWKRGRYLYSDVATLIDYIKIQSDHQREESES